MKQEPSGLPQSGHPGGVLPHLVIGGEMPCHAFTSRTLLLARGERITSASQLERLLRPDVIFSNQPPPYLVPAIAERQRALGIKSSDSPEARPDGAGAGSPAKPAADPADPAFWMPPGWPVRKVRQTGSVPFHLEILEAQAIHRQALRQVRELAEQARAGQRLDIAPVCDTVGQVIASLERNQQAFASLLWVKSRDDALHKHMINTCVLAAMLAEPAGLGAQAAVLALGALMHDIGKACLPASALGEEDGLSPADRELFEQHPTIGVELATRLQLPTVAREAIGQHHERFDGQGYPDGLRGQAISLAGRITAVANAYDSLRADRPGRPGMLACDAMHLLVEQAGTLFDPQAVGSLVRAIGLVPVGSLVRLSTGERALVATVNPEAITRPTVLVIATSDADTHTRPYLLDLNHAGPFSGREITAMENPHCSGLDVEHYLAMVPELAAKGRPSLSGLA